MKFLPIDEKKMLEIAEYLRQQKYRVCNYTIGSIFMWKDYFKNEYAITNNMLVIKGACPDGKITFTIPIGNGDFDLALDSIEDYAKENKIDIIFAAIPGQAIDALKRRYTLDEKPICNWFDYVYNVLDLAYLRGTPFSGQRNHVNRFKKTYINYRYKEIEKQDIPRILDFIDNYPKKENCNTELNVMADYDLFYSRKVIQNMDILNQLGGYLEVNGKIVAIAIGERIKDTLYVHIEKALRDYTGSFAMINAEFVLHNMDNSIKYVNREEDVGDFGLRRAKESYHPVMLLHKYTVKVNVIKRVKI